MYVIPVYMPDTADMYGVSVYLFLELRYGFVVTMRPVLDSPLAPPPPRGGAADNGPD